MPQYYDAKEGYSGGYVLNQTDEGGGMGLLDAFRVMKRRWYLVLAGIAVAFGPAWFLAPDGLTRHQAAAVVRLQDPRQTFTPGSAGVDTRSFEYLTSQTHIIRSEGLVGEVVDAEGLRLRPSANIPWSLVRDVQIVADANARDSLHVAFDGAGFQVRNLRGQEVTAEYGRTVEISGARFSFARRPVGEVDGVIVLRPRHLAINDVIFSLESVPRGGSAILDISYQDPDSARALQVVNAVARTYEDFNTRGVLSDAQRRVDFLEERLLEAEGEVLRARDALRAFQEADRVFGSVSRLQAEQARLVQLDDERRRLEEERRIYLSFLTRIEGASPEQIEAELRTLMAAPSVSSSPLLAPMFQQLNQHQLDRARLLAAGRSPTHPEVEQLSGLITATRTDIATQARTQLASLDLQISSVDQQRSQSTATLRAMPTTATEEQRLTTEVTTAQGTLAGLRNEYQRARLDASLEVGQAEVLDYAAYTVPVAAGRRIQILAIAFVLGLILGSGGALLVEITDTSVRGRAEAEEMLAVPSLGLIPRIEPVTASRKGRLLGRGSGAAKSGVNGRKVHVGTVANGTAKVSNVRPELQEFHTMAAEAYRMLRTNLAFLRPDQELRTLVVSSASSGEGKTTTAANLAASFARQGKRVLLVDCDLRRPRLHTFFDLDVKPGFTELILGTANGGTVRPTGIEGLSFLPRGEFNERAAELLGGSAGRELFLRLRERFDLVIIDTSPVLLTADALAVAPNADGVLLVMRAGQTPREAARMALQQLQVVGANVLGFVLNDPEGVGQLYGEGKYTKEYYAVDV